MIRRCCQSGLCLKQRRNRRSGCTGSSPKDNEPPVKITNATSIHSQHCIRSKKVCEYTFVLQAITMILLLSYKHFHLPPCHPRNTEVILSCLPSTLQCQQHVTVPRLQHSVLKIFDISHGVMFSTLWYPERHILMSPYRIKHCDDLL